MTSFMVNANSLKLCSNEMKNQGNSIRDISNGIKQCNNILKHHTTVHQLSNVLDVLYAQTLNAAAKEDKLSDALERIAKMYEDVEKLIQQETIESALNEDQNIGTEKRGWIKRFIDWLFHKNIDPSFVATTSEQEVAADQEMKNRVSELLANNKDYSQERWKNATIEERKALLQQFMHEVEGVLGISVLENINWTNTGIIDGKLNFGSYSHSNTTVSINEFVLSDPSSFDSYSLYNTIVHELRHAYQHQAVDHPERFQVSKETIDSWKESFRTYNEEKNKGFQAYRNIVVEKDARWFAGQN